VLALRLIEPMESAMCAALGVNVMSDPGRPRRPARRACHAASLMVTAGFAPHAG
jgi:hypothetical protein